MAEKYLKLIQDGVTSYAPDNRQTRAFWANYNKRVGGGKNSASEMVTIMTASDAEVEFMTKPATETTSSIQKHVDVTAATEEKFTKMQQQLESQQALINKLLLEKLSTPPEVNATPTVETQSNGGSEFSEPEKVKSKPGPKQKIENDGKDETKVNTEA